MFRVFPLLSLILLGGSAYAQDWPIRSGDAVLTQAEAEELTAGRTLKFYDDGRAKFSIGGAYSYTYGNDGGTAFGRFEVGKDGTVCIAFANGFGRCDLFVRNGERLVMLTEKGDRFPIRAD